MRLVISEQEWRAVLDRARDVGGGLGGPAGEGAAIVVARAALEAAGMVVPVIVDELDNPSPRAVSTEPTPDPTPDPVEPREPAPGRDLRLSARTLGNVDGWCDHCQQVVAAVRLAASPTGERLCPVHGAPVLDMVEVSEGRFEPVRAPGAGRCAAPIGGGFCQLNPGHLGRHSPLRAEPVETPTPRTAGGVLTADDHAPYPHEDHPGGHE